MAGVGKIGTVVLLLVLSVPVAARLSRPSAYGRQFSLSGWLLNVCHHHQPSRGTHRRSSHRPEEPLNALLEQQRQNELRCGATCSAAPAHSGFAIPAFILSFISGGKAGPIVNPAFLCTFLI